MDQKQPGQQKIPSVQPGHSSDDESDDSDDESDDDELTWFEETQTSLHTESSSDCSYEVSPTSYTGKMQSVVSESRPISEASCSLIGSRDPVASNTHLAVGYMEMDPSAMLNPYRVCLDDVDPYKIIGPILRKPSHELRPLLEPFPSTGDELGIVGDRIAHPDEHLLVLSKHDHDTTRTRQTKKLSTPAPHVQRAIPFRPSQNAPPRPPCDRIQRYCPPTKVVNFGTNSLQILLDTLHADMFSTKTEYIDMETNVELALLSREDEDWSIEKSYHVGTINNRIISTENSFWLKKDYEQRHTVASTEEANEGFQMHTEPTEIFTEISAPLDPETTANITLEQEGPTHLEEEDSAEEDFHSFPMPKMKEPQVNSFSDQVEGSQTRIGILDPKYTHRPGEICCEYERQPVPHRYSAPEDAAMEMSPPMATQNEEFSSIEAPESSAGECCSMLDTEEVLPENASNDTTQTIEIPTGELSRQHFTEDPTAGFSILSPKGCMTLTADLSTRIDSDVEAQPQESGLHETCGENVSNFTKLEILLEAWSRGLHTTFGTRLPESSSDREPGTADQDYVSLTKSKAVMPPQDDRESGTADQDYVSLTKSKAVMPPQDDREPGTADQDYVSLTKSKAVIPPQDDREPGTADQDYVSLTKSKAVMPPQDDRESGTADQDYVSLTKSKAVIPPQDNREPGTADQDYVSLTESKAVIPPQGLGVETGHQNRSTGLHEQSDHHGPQSSATDVSARGATSMSPEEQAISAVNASQSVSNNTLQDDEAQPQPGQVEHATPPEASDPAPSTPAVDSNHAVHRWYADVGTRELAVTGFFYAGVGRTDIATLNRPDAQTHSPGELARAHSCNEEPSPTSQQTPPADSSLQPGMKCFDGSYHEETELDRIIATEDNFWREKDHEQCHTVDITEESDEGFQRDTEPTEVVLKDISAPLAPETAADITGEQGGSTHLEEDSAMEGFRGSSMPNVEEPQRNTSLDRLEGSQTRIEVACLKQRLENCGEYMFQANSQRSSAFEDAATDISPPMASQNEEFHSIETPERYAGEFFSMLEARREVTTENVSDGRGQTRARLPESSGGHGPGTADEDNVSLVQSQGNIPSQDSHQENKHLIFLNIHKVPASQEEPSKAKSKNLEVPMQKSSKRRDCHNHSAAEPQEISSSETSLMKEGSDVMSEPRNTHHLKYLPHALWNPLFRHFCTIILRPLFPNWQKGPDEVDFSSPERTTMNITVFRLCTFSYCPNTEALPALRLANAGFYYTGRNGVVACYRCDLRCRHDDARLQRDPYAFHREMNQHCRHLNNTNQSHLFNQDHQSRAYSGRDITDSPSEETQRESVQGRTETARRETADAIADFLRRIGAETREPRRAALRGPDDHHGPPSSATDVSARGATSTSPEEQAISAINASPSTANNTSQDDEALPQPGQVERATPPGARDRAPSAPAVDSNHAVHRRYADVDSRERSFIGRWPDTHAQSPEGLAVAGFFYTGTGDCVRCFYCDLEWRQWLPDDKPLTVHMQNRPLCGFMRAILGHPAIARTLTMILRPMDGSRPENSQAAGGGGRRRDATTLIETPDTQAESPGELAGADSYGEAAAMPIRNLVSTTDAPEMLLYDEIELFLTPEEILLLQHLGYSDGDLLDGIQALRETVGHRAVTVYDLVQTMNSLRVRGLHLDSPTSGNPNIIDVSSDDSDEEAAPDPSEMHHCVNAGDNANDTSRGSSPTFPQGQRSPQTIRQLEQENLELRRRRRCKICLDNDVIITFLPCGHLACCAECAPALRRCPICRGRISDAISVQFAGPPSGQQP